MDKCGFYVEISRLRDDDNLLLITNSHHITTLSQQHQTQTILEMDIKIIDK